jgi:hypothetical protein
VDVYIYVIEMHVIKRILFILRYGTLSSVLVYYYYIQESCHTSSNFHGIYIFNLFECLSLKKRHDFYISMSKLFFNKLERKIFAN